MRSMLSLHHSLLAVFLALMLSHTACAPPIASAISDGPVVRLYGCDQTFGEHQAGPFRLLHDGDRQWAQRIGDLLEGQADLYRRTFEDAGFSLQTFTGPLTWVCFTSADAFHNYASKVDSMTGRRLDAYYSARTNRVAILRQGRSRGSSRLAFEADSEIGLHASDISSEDAVRARHEAAHQLAFNTGLLRRGLVYPMWATEGLATNLETGKGIGRAYEPDNPRSRHLATIRRSGRLIPLSELVGLTRVGDHSSHDVYAMSWAFFRFAYLRHRTALMTYLRAMQDLPTGRGSDARRSREFTSAFGPVELLEAQWEDFLAELAGHPRPPLPAVRRRI